FVLSIYHLLLISYYLFLSITAQPSRSTLFPYTTLFRSYWREKLLRNTERDALQIRQLQEMGWYVIVLWECEITYPPISWSCLIRSEEHTSELQSRFDLVCRLLLEKKNEEQVCSGSW